jgi:hypothetical protein
MQLPPTIWYQNIELWKLIVSAATPIAVVVIGFFLSRSIKEVEHKQWRTQTATEWRIKIYEEMWPLLDQVREHYTDPRHWNQLTPYMIPIEEDLDKQFRKAEPLFSFETRNRYDQFKFLCQATGDVPDSSHSDDDDALEIANSYTGLLESITDDLGLQMKSRVVRSRPGRCS